MSSVGRVCDFLGSVAPLRLAESWDNVGLLLGDRNGSAARIMTCLTVSEAVAQEAVSSKCDMIVSHHPIPFKPVARINTDSYTGRLLWQLASSGISVYAPHTAWDNCRLGINEQLANKLGLSEVGPIKESELVQSATSAATGNSNSSAEDQTDPGAHVGAVGSGRMGLVQDGDTLRSLASRLSELQGFRERTVGDADRPLRKVGICCGSGGSLLGAAIHAGCDAFLTGEATYHTCLEAEAAGVSMLMIGHHASERFSLEVLADRLAAEFPDCEVWASAQESDPVNGQSDA